MNIEKLIDILSKEYKDIFVGSTGNDEVMSFHFKINGKIKNVSIATTEDNKSAMEKIEILLKEYK